MPRSLSNAELAARARETVAAASLQLAFFMLANKWSVQGVLEEAGATEETLKSAWRETAERVARMAYEFNAAATGRTP